MSSKVQRCAVVLLEVFRYWCPDCGAEPRCVGKEDRSVDSSRSAGFSEVIGSNLNPRTRQRPSGLWEGVKFERESAGF